MKEKSNQLRHYTVFLINSKNKYTSNGNDNEITISATPTF
jgi:hypothetical protein